MLSQPGWPERLTGVPLPEVPCARCERRIRGLGWGELCPECQTERTRRARRLSRRISFPAALLMAGWVYLTVPEDPTARFYGGLAVVAVYVIVLRIAHQVAMEFLPR